MSNLVLPTFKFTDTEVTRSINWNVTVNESVSGMETRVRYWTTPVYEWTIQINALREYKDETATIQDFWNRHKGNFDSFLYIDPYENEVEGKQIGIGDGIKQDFYLCDSSDMPVKEINGEIVVKINDVIKIKDVDYTLTEGLVLFTEAPVENAVITWTGSYYRRVRFNMDSGIEFTRIARNVWQTEIYLKSVK